MISCILGLISYSVHSEPSDWISASKACSLATPEIDFKNGEHLTLSLNNTGLQLQTGEQYHLGYQLLDQTFQHLGIHYYYSFYHLFGQLKRHIAFVQPSFERTY